MSISAISFSCFLRRKGGRNGGRGRGDGVSVSLAAKAKKGRALSLFRNVQEAEKKKAFKHLCALLALSLSALLFSLCLYGALIARVDPSRNEKGELSGGERALWSKGGRVGVLLLRSVIGLRGRTRDDSRMRRLSFSIAAAASFPARSLRLFKQRGRSHTEACMS